MSRRRRVLFAFAGAGAGNASRIAAILEELDRERIEVALLSAPPALLPASVQDRHFPLELITYGAERFTVLQIARRNVTFPARYWRNRRLAGKAMDEFQPHLLVVDSEFCSVPEACRRRIPIVSINSSPATLRILRQMPRPSMHYAFSYCVERLDRHLLRHAERVLCPVLEDVETGGPTIQKVSLIVRRQFRRPASDGGALPQFDVGVMLGGSGLGVAALDLRGVHGSMVVLGKAGGRYPSHAVQLPFTPRPADVLARCRVLVVQGGFNSVSEAVALGKPVVIVPIPNHVEQLVNAWWANALGLGLMARGDEVGRHVAHLLSAPGNGPERRRVRCDGAAEAAAAIADVCHA